MILDLPRILQVLDAAGPASCRRVSGWSWPLVLVARLAPVLRQRAYDRTSEREVVRLVVAPPAGLDKDPELAVQLIRGLHPRQRRGFDAWRLGWPKAELRVVWRDGQLAWEISTNRQLAALATAQLRALYPGVQVDESSRRRSAGRRGRGRATRSLRSAGRCASSSRRRRASSERWPGPSRAHRPRRRSGSGSPSDRCRPTPGDGRSRRPRPARSASILGLIGTRDHRRGPSSPDRRVVAGPGADPTCSGRTRRASAGKQRGVVAFDVGLRARGRRDRPGGGGGPPVASRPLHE